MLTVVVGTQFGDEGKGAITHRLSLDEHIVAGARAQGANNAGHTIHPEELPDNAESYKLHLVPSSVIAGKKGYIGRGCAVDLDVLVKEIEKLKQRGLSPDVVLDPCAHVILPWHKELDGVNDSAQGNFSAGSTRRGVGPVYGAKHERWGIRVADLFEDPKRVEQVQEHYLERCAPGLFSLWTRRTLQKSYSQKLENSKNLFSPYYEQIVSDVALKVEGLLREEKGIIGECAQGEMLDVNNAYYPRGTSSETNAPGIWVGLGIGPRPEYLGPVYGVAKAYVSRVGNGPFLTELIGDAEDLLREKGKEYGTTTGRPRRVGWFDAHMVRVANRASGITGLAVTKIDILGGMDNIKLAYDYQTPFSKFLSNAVLPVDYGLCVPLYETFRGWPDFTEEEYRQQLADGIDGIKDSNLKTYLKAIEATTDLPIHMVSFGPKSGAFTSYV